MGRYTKSKDGGKPKLKERPKPVSFQQYTTVLAERDTFKKSLDELGGFIEANYADQIKEGDTAVSLAIRLLTKPGKVKENPDKRTPTQKSVGLDKAE